VDELHQICEGHRPIIGALKETFRFPLLLRFVENRSQLSDFFTCKK